MNCPKCGGPTWDNRESKKNPRQPDYKCKDKSCDGVIWPAKEKKEAAATAPVDNGTFDELAEKYAQCVGKVVPLVKRLTELGITIDGEAVSSMTATLFIARQNAKV